MAHGYMRDYDERPEDDRDRGDWRERSEWRSRDERDWRDRDPVWRNDPQTERGRGFMLGDDDRDYSRNRGGQGRGFFSRMENEARSWFGDDDRGDRGAWENNRDWPQRDREQQRYRSHPDDHYRSWRDRQIQSLDRDYEDYCREREQQFHRDFDSWRANRQRIGLRVGTPLEQGTGPDEQTFTPETTAVGNTMTTSETHEPQSTTTPEDTATIGVARRRPYKDA
jgi:hypothetical protein